MKSLTKNHVQREVLNRICRRAFPEHSMVQVTELTEGFFNAAYLIELSGQKEVVLKIGPKPSARIQGYEKNIMNSEVKSMELVEQLKPEIPVAKILYYDSTRELCESEYFFMEKLSGISMNIQKEHFTKEELGAVNRGLGIINKSLNEIVGDKFGLLGQEKYQGKNWFEVFFSMVELALSDRKKLNIDLNNKEKEIEELMLLNKVVFKDAFEEVAAPKLIHWDLWEANIFVENGKISGIIDFERSLFGDELMELGFRKHYRIPEFLEGYGKTSFTKLEKIRCIWYDIYLYLLMSLEYDYREYEHRGTFDWPFEMLKDSIEKLNEELII